MTNNETVNPVDGIVEMLDVSAGEIRMLRASTEVWYRLIHPIDRYPVARELIRRWYVDHVIVGCRRQMDSGRDVASLKRALLDMQSIEGEAPGSLDAYRNRRGLVPQDGSWAWPPHPQSVDCTSPSSWLYVDLARIEDLGRDIRNAATATVAHRLSRAVEMITADEVGRLLDELSEIHARWSVQLQGVDVAHDVAGLEPVDRMALALHLFHWEDFIDAQMEAVGETGHSPELVRAMARLSYHFDGARFPDRRSTQGMEDC